MCVISPMNVTERWTAKTYLVVVRRRHKDDGPITGDMEGAPRAYLAEEYVDNEFPEEQRGVVHKVRRHLSRNARLLPTGDASRRHRALYKSAVATDEI